jgi:hypothetical protein
MLPVLFFAIGLLLYVPLCLCCRMIRIYRLVDGSIQRILRYVIVVVSYVFVT